ncbi:hypothetical protein JNUCC42_04395 [Brevibacterium sp. JNUCC-42]|nr:hypothetical protein JNUCC42_04395 [Brevibacterium sp. JNUCC-42]
MLIKEVINIQNITLRTMSGDTLVSETSLQIKEEDILIQKIPENYPLEEAQKVHDFLMSTLANNSNVITIGQGVELQVLSINIK